jgi:hypothetical protein
VEKKKKTLVGVNDIDAALDQIGIPKGGKAREKARTYCTAKINSTEGKCIAADDLSLLAHGYYDGISESLRGG